MDIYLLEAIINGILLGGVLALLALGLNLIFGVVDVVWISYADVVMCGMYGVYFLYVQYHLPLPLACLIAIVGAACIGIIVHKLIISPVLDSPPLNQLLATGGLLFFLQSFATLLFGTDFRNIGVRLPPVPPRLHGAHLARDHLPLRRPDEVRPRAGHRRDPSARPRALGERGGLRSPSRRHIRGRRLGALLRPRRRHRALRGGRARGGGL
ncbi:MAG TPA: hypothetical protein VLL30_08230, partial [Reyranella sp.]|nr:hypothetical protein [Reyranella sp.]